MGRKILTVDDSKTIRLIVAKAFKTFDCEILEGANGVEGLAVATREKPDVTHKPKHFVATHLDCYRIERPTHYLYLLHCSIHQYAPAPRESMFRYSL